MNSTGLIAKVLSKRTEELISRLQTTLALRQGLKPLPDYWLYVNLTPMGIAVSSIVLLSIVIFEVNSCSHISDIINYFLLGAIFSIEISDSITDSTIGAATVPPEPSLGSSITAKTTYRGASTGIIPTKLVIIALSE